MSDIKTKVCPACKRDLPLDAAHFGRRPESRDGFRKRCKECEGRPFGEFKNLTAQSGYRRCTLCRQEFPETTDWFYPRPSSRGGLTAACRACLKKLARQRRQIDDEKAKRRVREQDYWNRPENKLRRKLQKREVQRRIRQTDRHKTWYSEYYRRETTQLSMKLASVRRRTAKRNLPSDLTPADWKRCLDYWEHQCCICGRAEGLWHTIAQEHWIALSDNRADNPGTVVWNILPMCHAQKGSNGQGGCNNLKGSRDPLDFLYAEFPRQQADKILRQIERYFAWAIEQKRGE
jgi:hypothetical protein